MGIIGGLTGALFCHLNYKLTVFRMRYTVFIQTKFVLIIKSIVHYAFKTGA